MQGVFVATAAILVKFETIGIVPTILLSCVITFLALGALEVNYHANVFLSHDYLSFRQKVEGREAKSRPPTPL